MEEPVDFLLDEESDQSDLHDENAFQGGLLTQACNGNFQSERSHEDDSIDGDDAGSEGLAPNDDRGGMLLTQACDDSFESEMLDDESANDNDKHQIRGKTPNFMSSAQKASKISSALEEVSQSDPFLAAQSKRLFAESFGDDNMEDSSSSGDYESSDESSIEQNRVSTPIQVRRARNIHRHNEFAKSLNLGQFSDMNGDAAEPTEKLKPKRTKTVTNSYHDEDSENETSADVQPTKKRGMTFTPNVWNEMPRDLTDAKSPSSLVTNTITQQLEAKYPCRSLQMRVLSSHLEFVARKTELAWQANSSKHKNFSETSQQGEIKFAAPAPILITGSGGTGKTSITRDVVKTVQEKLNNIPGETKSRSQMAKTNIVSVAYIDCAEADGSDVAFALKSALAQLKDCYQPKDSHVHRQTESTPKDDRTDKSSQRNKRISFGCVKLQDFGTNVFSESEGEVVEDLDAEDLFQLRRKRTRSQQGSKKAGMSSKKAKVLGNTLSDRSSNYHRVARQNSTTASSTSGPNQFRRASRYSYDSSPIALFGRALSTLLRKKRAKYGRCSFLIIDNAERIKSWKKAAGSRNALAQLFKLPNVMGVNLTMIFISRSSLLSHSGLASHKSPGKIIDAAQPINIHFDSYTNVDTMKKILCTPHVQQLVTGPAYAPCDEKTCALLNSINSELNSIIYKSMMSTFLQAVKGSTFDVTEIMRLSRVLWPEFVRAFSESNGEESDKKEGAKKKVINEEHIKEYQALMFDMMDCLKRDSAYPSCANDKCIICTRKVGDKDIKLNDIKGKLSEKLDHKIRETVRALMTSVLLMPGRVIEKNIEKPFAARLPYNTKFLLLAAFLCTQKRAEHDINLFTTTNTGRRSNRGAKQVDEGTAYASLNQLRAAKIPSFPVERLFGIYSAIIGQYGRTTRRAINAGTLGAEELLKNISALIDAGLLQPASNATVTAGVKKTDLVLRKFSCTLSRAEADVIASDVGFPLSNYCS